MKDDFAIRRSPQLGRQVYGSLRGMMEAQLFKPGESMVETELAKRLNVSRTPVREALFRLEADGLVEQQGGHFVIPRLTKNDIRDIFEIRRLLETEAAAEIATRLSDADMQEIVEARDAVLKAQTPDGAVQANSDFRATWLARIWNKRLLQILVKFDDQVSLVRHATLVDSTSRKAAQACVSTLTEAFLARDPRRAREAMASFIDAASRAFEAAVGRTEESSEHSQ